MFGKRQSGSIPVISIFLSGGIEASSRPHISCACHFSWSLGSGCFIITNLASSFRAASYSATDILIMPTKPSLNPVDSDGTVSGRRVSSTRCTVDSTGLDSIIEPPRASIPRRVRTLHALSLCPPLAASDSDTASKN